MRWIFGSCALAALIAGLMTAPSAQAREYPWCAIYAGNSGVQNCGFVTFQQCLATIRGMGGFCQRNPLYNDERPVRRYEERHYRY